MRSLLKKIKKVFGITVVSPLNGGHMNIPLFNCIRISDGMELVLKIGMGTQGQPEEVLGNIKGYGAIHIIGAGTWLPAPLIVKDFDGIPVLLMGKIQVPNLTGLLRSGSASTGVNVLSRFIDNFVRVTVLTVVGNDRCEPCNNACGEVIGKITDLYSQHLEPAGLISAGFEVPSIFEQCDTHAIMCMDFTSDNLFMYRHKVTFIDPWMQSSYLGNPAVSLGQFTTLARDVYSLPGASDLGVCVESAIERISVLTGMDLKWLNQGILVGASLQFALSSFVRIDTDIEGAANYAIRSKNALLRAKEK
ncbi:MAG: hypothetical protein Q8P30_03235 [Candidatus Uhrbacteria bacterium]|nr:hypothetical protein [Candidatus Uhrbacteria bacterium]